MKLLFENWREYLAEDLEDLDRSAIDDAIQNAGFNNTQSSHHRWSVGQPYIDYWTDENTGERMYLAGIPTGDDDANNWPIKYSEPGETLQAFLNRVEDPVQLNLFENWQKYITEGMKTPKDLPKHVYVGIKQDEMEDGHGQVAFYYSDSRGNEIGPYDEYTGQVAIERPEGHNMPGRVGVGNCDNAWIVAGSEAEYGFGPLLYDVAMEWATLNGNGLTSDRYEVSAQARKVWDYYLNNRGDVKNSQLDDMQNTLTKPKEDNCNQYSAGRDANKVSGLATLQALLGGEKEPPPDESKWKSSPLSKRYTKEPARMRELTKLKKLIDFTKGS
jgi:hypothetical protein